MRHVGGAFTHCVLLFLFYFFLSFYFSFPGGLLTVEWSYALNCSVLVTFESLCCFCLCSSNSSLLTTIYRQPKHNKFDNNLSMLPQTRCDNIEVVVRSIVWQPPVDVVTTRRVTIVFNRTWSLSLLQSKCMVFSVHLGMTNVFASISWV